MPKILKFISIILFFLSLFPIASSQAQTTDPSPYGSYRELRTKRMAIGSLYTSTKDYCWPEDAGYTCSPIYTDLDNNGWTPGEEDLVSLVVQGNVGIGTTKPEMRLEIRDDRGGASEGTYVPLLKIAQTDDAIRGTIGNRVLSNNIRQGLKISALQSLTLHAQNYDIDFQTGTVADETKDDNLVMRIKNNGNVGIGTTEPQAKLEVNDTVRFTPRASEPTTWAAGLGGELAFSSMYGSFYYYNGSAWVKQSGGGVGFTYYCHTTTQTSGNKCVDVGGTQKYCPSGFKQIQDLGEWGTCTSPSFGSHYGFPPGGVCYSSYGSFSRDVVGKAYFCEQQ
ncbi:MAG: hypothetical protein MUC39_01005 [Candidatus Omnitrophica bacterium]|nr:hypothetical protein [Candidatus Omnitrophota bacterium]